MADINKPKKHRHKRHYTFMIISGDSDGSSGSIHLGHIATQVLAFSIFAVFVALVCFLVNSAITVSSLKKYTAEQEARILELDEENKTLTKSNSELQNEVTQLSQALNQKVEAEAQSAAEAEQLSIPSQLPISGTASMISTYDDPGSSEIAIAGIIDADGNAIDQSENAENNDENGEENAENTEENTDEATEPVDVSTLDPILLLTTEEGSTIIASGAGTVTSVAGDIKYGNSVTIDHGNGYISIYRNSGESLVHEGDTVVKGATLFVVGSDNTKLGYQIKKDGVFINPEELVQING
ncbi:peptidoglycan DD-metalloendopeptidase family protein [Butyrivibrio sp. LC3010]|uniref:peptidoglycan DD-metalloendopeptidase family protein n=1 Tax=Butyrivibrio sp. LC3010 TaxID=1280680 RepID=UPI00040AAD5D|nr:peptidoglycan DD-metalloendopeptidase family protein [Butyrivibrio sp. LC3010]